MSRAKYLRKKELAAENYRFHRERVGLRQINGLFNRASNRLGFRCPRDFFTTVPFSRTSVPGEQLRKQNYYAIFGKLMAQIRNGGRLVRYGN